MAPPHVNERSLQLAVGGVTLAADLAMPAGAAGIVVFAHGSGSGRRSPRNRMVAQHLHRVGLATLLLDLLTAEEAREDERTARLRFDVQLLGERVTGAVDWLGTEPALERLPVGCFGASTGAGAALLAAAERPRRIGAVVSRGGRPDLAERALDSVAAQTLLIVGGHDPEVLELNRRAQDALGASCRLEVVPNATHLFEEPGALERVAELAGDWLRRHLVPSAEQHQVESDRASP